MQRIFIFPLQVCRWHAPWSAISVASILAVAFSLAVDEVRAETNYRDDDVAMVLVFSLRETAQMHTLAKALAKSSLKGMPSEDIVPQCERAIDSFEAISVPILRKYLGNVEHDPQTRETFDGILEVQQAVLAEMRAVKAMADSGNDDDSIRALVAAGERYDDIAKGVIGAIFRAKDTSQPAEAAGQPDAGGGSPNARVFSDDEWAGVVALLRQQGIVRTPEDAEVYFGTFALLKSVFVEKRIPDPSPKQLFRLAKMLSIAFGQMPPENIETTLSAMLQLADETGTEVASRDTLLSLDE